MIKKFAPLFLAVLSSLPQLAVSQTATSPTTTGTSNTSNLSRFSKINRANTAQPSSFTLPPSLLNRSPKAPIWLDPSKNNALPIEIECNIARLLVLEQTPVVTDGSEPFAVVATVYASLLNLFATDDPSQKIMYTDNIKPYIEQHADSNGNYTYTTVLGFENTLLGYSHCLSATTFRDVLCPDQSNFFTLDANVDSNQQTYFWVHFTTLFFTPDDDSDNGLTHYQWIYGDGTEGNYYDFYLTKDHPDYKNSPDLSHYIPNIATLCIRSLTGNIWVGSRDNTHLNHDWTVTGNKLSGLSMSIDGEVPVNPVNSTSPSQPNTPSQPAISDNKEHSGSAWDDYLQNGAGSAWEEFTKNGAGSAWEEFTKNGAGSAWEAYLAGHPDQTKKPKNSVSSIPTTATATSPTSSEKDSSQKNPVLDKETEARVKLAVELYQQGTPIDEITAKTGFSEEELREIFSRLSK